MTTTYTTRDEAIVREIVNPIEASGEAADACAEFDIEAIADEVLGDYSEGYALKVEDDEFWASVQRHAKNTTYTTRTEAIEREIVNPIEASGEVTDAWTEFDIEAIADEVLGDYSEGFACKVEAEEFWASVQRHAK